jgi:hypothetical protein
MTAEGHFRRWAWLVVLLLPALRWFAWAGSSYDPRFAIPWTWTKSGWIVPAPGLGCVWIFAAILIWLLSEIAWLLFNPIAGATRLKPWASVGIIFGLAVFTRVLIGCWWTPLPLVPGLLTLKALPSASALRWLAILADLGTVGLLMLTLAGSGRSVWWAALYALHPLVLLEMAGNGHWISFVVLPVIFLLGISHRMGAPIRTAIAITMAVAAVVAVWVAGQHAGFNSLAYESLRTSGIDGKVLLPVVCVILQASVLFIAHRRGWTLARTVAHLLLVCLICSPVVMPWAVVPLVAIAPLAWTRAGWVLAALILGAYMAVPIVQAGGRFSVKDWYLMVTWIPVIVLELHELAGEAVALFKRGASSAEASPVT